MKEAVTMNKWITFLCAFALIFSTQAYAGKRTNAAVLGFIGGYVVGKHVEKKKRPSRRHVVRARSPMAQAFRSQSRYIRKQIQVKLQEKGLYRSYIDGAWGRGTRTAMESFAIDEGKSHLLTTETGANQLMGILLNPEQGQQQQIGQDTGAMPEMVQTGGGDALDDLADIAPDSTGNADEIADIKSKLSIAHRQHTLLKEVLRVQSRNGSRQDPFTQAKIEAVTARVAAIEMFQDKTISNAEGRYDMPITPASSSMEIAQSKISRIFPKLPYSTTGTDQIGEMRITPRVTSKGVLVYEFNFLEPGADLDRIRETLSMYNEDVSSIMFGLEKTHEWSEVAQSKGVRQNHEKVAVCFPENMCEDKIAGVVSTEVIFVLYTDGATAAKIQRNNGSAVSGYNLSIDSALVLASYLDYMKTEGEAGFSTGTVTNADLDTLFK